MFCTLTRVGVCFHSEACSRKHLYYTSRKPDQYSWSTLTKSCHVKQFFEIIKMWFSSSALFRVESMILLIVLWLFKSGCLILLQVTQSGLYLWHAIQRKLMAWQFRNLLNVIYHVAVFFSFQVVGLRNNNRKIDLWMNGLVDWLTKITCITWQSVTKKINNMKWFGG